MARKGRGGLGALTLAGLFACSPATSPAPEARDIPPAPVTQTPSAEPEEGPPGSVEPGTGGDNTPPPTPSPGPSEGFVLRGSPDLLLGPEGYSSIDVSVAPDGTFALTAALHDPRADTRLLVGRYTPEGHPLWSRIIHAQAGWEGGRVTTTARGDVFLWVHTAKGQELGWSADSDYLLVRFAPDGRRVWTQSVPCDSGELYVDDSDAVTVLQGSCMLPRPPDAVLRFNASGTRVFLRDALDLDLLVRQQAVNPEGLSLVGGRSLGTVNPRENNESRGLLLGPGGELRHRVGGVRDVKGVFLPVHLSRQGDYLALLQVWDGMGTFAGQRVECLQTPDWQQCAPLLLRGNVNGREDSVGVLPHGERILQATSSGEVWTLAYNAARTGSILRRRSATGQLLAQREFAPVGAGDAPHAFVRVDGVALHADGSLRVLGSFGGQADLGGTRVSAQAVRVFLLRMER